MFYYVSSVKQGHCPGYWRHKRPDTGDTGDELLQVCICGWVDTHQAGVEEHWQDDHEQAGMLHPFLLLPHCVYNWWWCSVSTLSLFRYRPVFPEQYESQLLLRCCGLARGSLTTGRHALLLTHWEQWCHTSYYLHISTHIDAYLSISTFIY